VLFPEIRIQNPVQYTYFHATEEVKRKDFIGLIDERKYEDNKYVLGRITHSTIILTIGTDLVQTTE